MNKKLANKIRGDKEFLMGTTHKARTMVNIGCVRIALSGHVGFLVGWQHKKSSMPNKHQVYIKIPFISIYIYLS